MNEKQSTVRVTNIGITSCELDRQSYTSHEPQLKLQKANFIFHPLIAWLQNIVQQQLKNGLEFTIYKILDDVTIWIIEDYNLLKLLHGEESSIKVKVNIF